jgi:hypothetical protein
LSFCAFVQILVRQPQFAVPTPIGISDFQELAHVMALPIKLFCKEHT